MGNELSEGDDATFNCTYAYLLSEESEIKPCANALTSRSTLNSLHGHDRDTLDDGGYGSTSIPVLFDR